MGKFRWQPAEKKCPGKNISHRKLQNNISVGKKSGRPAKRNCFPGRYSHRNLKIHFLWENSAGSLQKKPACAEIFPIENVKSYFLWEKKSGGGCLKTWFARKIFPQKSKNTFFMGKIRWQPVETTFLRRIITHRIHDIVLPVGETICQPPEIPPRAQIFPTINAFFLLVISHKKSLYIVWKKNGTSYKNFTKKMKKKRKSSKMWYYNPIRCTKRGKTMAKEVIEEIEERPDGSKKVVKRTVEKGVSFGSVLAMVISFATWKSVGWAIVHGLMGWVYVVYFLIKYR